MMSTKQGKAAKKAEVDLVALQQILDLNDIKGCLEFFSGMSEDDRRQCFPLVKAFWSNVRKNRFIEGPPNTFHWNPLEKIAQTAFFSTATGVEILKAKRNGYPPHEYAFAVLADRRPPWSQQWAETLLNQSYFWNNWGLIRNLIEAGLIKKPDTQRYYLAMIGGINSRVAEVNLVQELVRSPDLLEHDIWKLFEYEGDGENSLANTERFNHSWFDAFLKLIAKGKLPRAKVLEATVEALERDFNHYRARWFYEFFDRLEPTSAELAKYSERLLGLIGASAPNVASWALAKAELLAADKKFDSSVLCHAVKPMLRARSKGSVLAVLKLLQGHVAANTKATNEVVATVAIALAHESAEVQKAALKLLDTIASPDDPIVRTTLEKLQPTLAASVRSLVNKWLSKSSQPAGTSKSAFVSKSSPDTSLRNAKSTKSKSSIDRSSLSKQTETIYAIDILKKNLEISLLSIPAAKFDGTDIPRLSLLQPIKPIENLEQLIDTCAQVIEDGTLVDDAERCIDGFARLGGVKPDDIQRLTAPILKRVRKLIQKGCSPFCGMDPANDLLGLLYAFATGNVIEPTLKGSRLLFDFEGEKQTEYAINMKKALGFLSGRCLSIARRVAAGDSIPLLSFPTHVGGWIDPCTLAERINAWTGEAPDSHDLILSMLRLAPDNRASALKMIKNKNGEWIDAIRYALNAGGINIGPSAPLWAAAARARSPWTDDPQVAKKHPNLGPDAAESAKFSFLCKKRKSHSFTFHEPGFSVEPTVRSAIDPLFVTVQMLTSRTLGNEYSYEMGGFAGPTVGAVRWTASIWPLARESFCIGAVTDCLSNLDWSEAQWQNRAMLEPLIDSGTPLRTAGLLFLCGMLGAKEPGESGLATDIAIRAIAEGRLGSDNLGEGLSLLLCTGLIKPGRWAKTLAEVARISSLHAAVVRLGLESCFVDSKQELPKDSGKLLELVYELSMELNTPIVSEACRDWLASGKLSGKSVKVAKSILEIESSADSNNSIQSALEQAIDERIAEATKRRGV